MGGKALTLYQERIFAIVRLLIKNNIDSVLDCGCGDGKLLKELANSNHFKMLAGVDCSLKRVLKAKKNNKGNNVIFFNQSFFETIPEFKKYDAIVASEIIEHFSSDELEAFFRISLCDLLVKLLIITTPNKSYNYHYDILYDGLRHSSHKFEMDEEDILKFTKFMKEKFPQYNIVCGFCDSNHASHLIIFERRT